MLLARARRVEVENELGRRLDLIRKLDRVADPYLLRIRAVSDVPNFSLFHPSRLTLAACPSTD